MNDVHLKVVGTGFYLPEKIVTNKDFEGRDFFKYDIDGNKIGDGASITADKIYEMSGIRERHYAADGETPSSMGTLAAIRAIDDAGIDPRSLSGIILATVSDNITFPAGACAIQAGLENAYGMVMNNCVSYNVGAACAGSVLGMQLANSMALRRKGNYLVVGAEDIPGIVDDDDRNKFLFGAGAGAVVLSPTMAYEGIIGEYTKSETHDGKFPLIAMDKKGKLRMPEGGLVMKEAVRGMVNSVKKLKNNVGWDKADIYIPHQANGRILDNIEGKVSRDGAVVYRNIEKTGNMSAATCLVALDDARKEGIIRKDSKVIVTSFGSGLITTAVAVQF